MQCAKGAQTKHLRSFAFICVFFFFFFFLEVHFMRMAQSLICLLLFSATLSAETKSLKTINIDITSHLGDQQEFQQNDVVSFLLNLDRDAYVFVIYQDASQQRVQIIPNKIQRQHFYKAGFFIAVPAENSAFQFVIQPPFGKETLWVFATDAAALILAGQVQGNGLKLLKSDINSIRVQIKQQSKQFFGEARFSLYTRAGL